MEAHASAFIYDKIYNFKDYETESGQLHQIIQGLNPAASTLLDVACGTGRHLERLKAHYRCQGLDLSPALLQGARERNPELVFQQGDMRHFDLGQRFDAVTCLFSAIGYLGGVEELNQAVTTMVDHLNPGGVLIIEPWFYPQTWQNGHIAVRYVDEPELKIVRMNTSLTEGRTAVMEMHHLVGRPEKTQHFVETLRLFLFTHQEYLAAFAQAGLHATLDPQGLTGRGLYVGQTRRPAGEQKSIGAGEKNS